MNIGFVLFETLTQLDLTGPLQAMTHVPGAAVHLVGQSDAPVQTDTALTIPPTTTFDACPQLDLICVPGGLGVAAALSNVQLIDFVKSQAEQARYVTSVCTGAFILGAAGLLDGKKATCHWGYTHLLSSYGAVHTPGRVVRDGNVFTGGGVTAGLDFAITIVAEIAGEETAKAIQLAIEYDPAPPFECGHPDVASDEVKARLAPLYAQRGAEMAAAIEASKV
ncbi:MAG: DJ-1/PfpI family protein [Pseudomonadota bacterium]